MTNPIDVTRIIKEADLKIKDVASALFPTNNRPESALHRIQTGLGQLSESQIIKLSEITGFSIPRLFGKEEPDWNMHRESDNVTISKGDYTAVLDLSTFMVSVSEKGSLFFYDRALVSESISLLDFILSVQNIIKNKDHDRNIKFGVPGGFETPERAFFGPVGPDGTRPGDKEYAGVAIETGES